MSAEISKLVSDLRVFLHLKQTYLEMRALGLETNGCLYGISSSAGAILRALGRPSDDPALEPIRRELVRDVSTLEALPDGDPSGVKRWLGILEKWQSIIEQTPVAAPRATASGHQPLMTICPEGNGKPNASPASGNPAPPPPEAAAELSIAPASGAAIPEATIPRGGRKEPSQKAIAAYRAVKIMGQKQENVAPRFGVGQGSISRWVTQVSAWIAAGNVLPDLDTPKPKTISMDPRKLEQGPRRPAHKPENMRDPSR